MKKIFIFIIIIFLGWFGINILYKKMTTFDGSEDSLYRMMKTIPLNEQVKFIKDFEIVLGAYQGKEHKLVGFKVEDIKEEANNIKKWISKQNITFLESLIDKLSNSNENSTFLHISKSGRIYEPRAGYIYEKTYSINDLNKLLQEQKNIINK